MVRDLTIGVTGSNGFLGQYLVKELRHKGYSVHEFTTNPKNKLQIKLNYSDTKSMKESFLKIDVLIHAAWTSGSRSNRENFELQNLNVIISENISRVAQEINLKRIIGIGSQDELRNNSKPWTDDEEFEPQSYYSEAKLATYNNLSESTEQFIWARLLSVYGVGDPRDWILTKTVSALKLNKQLRVGKCDQLFNFTHIKDATDGIILLMEKGFIGSANVATLESPTLKNSLDLLEDISGRKGLIKYGPYSDTRNQVRSPGILEVLGWVPKIKREIGFRELFDN